MATLAEALLKASTIPQTGLVDAFQQGQQRGRQANLMGSLAGGAPRSEVLQNLSYVDPMMAGREMGVFTSHAKPQENATKRRARELEQLWKDSERSLRFAREKGDTAGINYYEGLQAKLKGQLSQMRPEIWAEEPVTTATEASVATPQGQVDFTEITEQVRVGAVDTDKDGIIDDRPEWKKAVVDWARDNGLPTNDPKYLTLVEYMKNLEADIAKKKEFGIETEERQYKRSRESEKVGRDIAKDKIAQDEKYQMPWNAMKDLRNDPTITNKRKALNVKLRDESGAAIGADEFENMMSFVLPTDAYNKFKAEATGPLQTLIGTINNSSRESYMKQLVEKYLNQVDHTSLANYIDDSISPEYYNKKQGNKKGRFSKFNKGKK